MTNTISDDGALKREYSQCMDGFVIATGQGRLQGIDAITELRRMLNNAIDRAYSAGLEQGKRIENEELKQHLARCHSTIEKQENLIIKLRSEIDGGKTADEILSHLAIKD